MISSSEVLRRRLAALLAETESLVHPERIVTMDPADRAAAMTKTWNLRRDWKHFKDDLDEKTSYDNFSGHQWTDVVVEVSNLIERVRRFDWLQMEFLIHSQRSVLDGVHTLCAIEATRIAQYNPEPDL